MGLFRIAEEDSEAYGLSSFCLPSGRKLLFSSSIYAEGAKELLADTAFTYRLSPEDFRAFLKHMVNSGENFLLNGLDGGAQDPLLPLLALAENPNYVPLGPDWLASLSSDHRRKVRKHLAMPYTHRIVSPREVDIEVHDRLLESQTLRLVNDHWQKTGARTRRLLTLRWPLYIRAAAIEGPDVQCHVAYDSAGRHAAILYAQIMADSKVTFLITLMGEDAQGAGLFLMAKAILHYAAEGLKCFDLMMGCDYKKVYEPEKTAPPTYQMAVYAERPGYDSSMLFESIPLPPFIAAGKLFTLREVDLPALD